MDDVAEVCLNGGLGRRANLDVVLGWRHLPSVCCEMSDERMNLLELLLSRLSVFRLSFALRLRSERDVC